MKIINPATEEIIKEVKEDNESSLKRKWGSLKVAQEKWAGLPLKERVDVLKKFSSLLERDIEQLASVLTSEVGKPLSQSRNEIKGATGQNKMVDRKRREVLVGRMDE